jgi:hypothetical protein
MSNNRNNPDD